MNGSRRKDAAHIVVLKSHVCRNLYAEPNDGSEHFASESARGAGELSLENRLDGSHE